MKLALPENERFTPWYFSDTCLEKISNHITRTLNEDESTIIEFLEYCGVEKSLIKSQKIKWLIVYNVLRTLLSLKTNNAEKSRDVAYKIITHSLSPNYYKTDEDRLKAINQYNNCLESSFKKIVIDDENSCLIRKAYLATPIMDEKYNGQVDKEEKELLSIFKDFHVEIATLQRAYGFLVDVLYVFSQTTSTIIDKSLNTFYMELAELIKEKAYTLQQALYDADKAYQNTDRMDDFPYLILETSDLFAYYLPPFDDLLQAKDQIKILGTNWDEIRTRLNNSKSNLDRTANFFNIQNMENLPDHKLFNKVEKYLVYLHSNNTSLKSQMGLITLDAGGNAVIKLPDGTISTAYLNPGIAKKEKETADDGYLLLKRMTRTSIPVPPDDLKNILKPGKHKSEQNPQKPSERFEELRKRIKNKFDPKINTDDIFMGDGKGNYSLAYVGRFIETLSNPS